MHRLRIEEVKPADTPEQMRAELFRLRRYDAFVRRVLDYSDLQGLSAEDKYTVIAYEALRQLNEMKVQLLTIHHTAVRKPVFSDDRSFPTE